MKNLIKDIFMIFKGVNMDDKNNVESSALKPEDSDIVSEEIKFNSQNGEGYYREVTYKDGGFRQFDNKTGELIGSSYDEDQEKLGVVNGSLE